VHFVELGAIIAGNQVAGLYLLFTILLCSVLPDFSHYCKPHSTSWWRL